MRFLFLEDSLIDASLIQRHLQSSGLIFDHARVETKQEFTDSIQHNRWTCIFSDYNLPSFDPYQAIKILDELQLDIPIIIVSGAIQDTQAAAILKVGAIDFISKDDLSRLVPAIHREIKEFEVRRERLALSQRLEMAKDVAELANKRKSRVLAFVAHEFKNPLKSIELFADMLLQAKENPIPEEHIEKVEAITEACKHIRNLVDDINDISPIESGQFSLNYETLLIRPLLEEVRTLLLPLARKRQITLDIHLADSYLTIKADKQRLRQILINLVSNAIKYTNPDDVVTTEAFIKHNSIVLQVIDYGPGIPRSELDKLFEDFYRVNNVFSTRTEGLGLGLALTKSLVERHGGTIHVTSEVNKGSTFRVNLPLSPPEEIGFSR